MCRGLCYFRVGLHQPLYKAGVFTLLCKLRHKQLTNIATNPHYNVNVKAKLEYRSRQLSFQTISTISPAKIKPSYHPHCLLTSSFTFSAIPFIIPELFFLKTPLPPTTTHSFSSLLPWWTAWVETQGCQWQPCGRARTSHGHTPAVGCWGMRLVVWVDYVGAPL